MSIRVRKEVSVKIIFENVAGKEDRFADFLAFLDEFGDVASTERIESRLWLVEYDEFGVADEGLSEPDALEHAF